MHTMAAICRLSPTGADDRLLDCIGRIFRDRQVRKRARAAHAACLASFSVAAASRLTGRLRSFLRTIFGNRHQPVMELAQAFGDDIAIQRTVPEAMSELAQSTMPTRTAQARINADD